MLVIVWELICCIHLCLTDAGIWPFACRPPSSTASRLIKRATWFRCTSEFHEGEITPISATSLSNKFCLINCLLVLLDEELHHWVLYSSDQCREEVSSSRRRVPISVVKPSVVRSVEHQGWSSTDEWVRCCVRDVALLWHAEDHMHFIPRAPEVELLVGWRNHDGCRSRKKPESKWRNIKIHHVVGISRFFLNKLTKMHVWSKFSKKKNFYFFF